MAATDQTYREQKILDIVFGASCALMLITTGWMFWQDYNREFKAVQRTFRDVETGLAEHEMVDKLPDPDTVEEKRKDLRRARIRLEFAGAQSILGDEFETLIAGTFSSNGDERQDARAKLQSANAQFLKIKSQIEAEHDKADELYRTTKAKLDAETSYYNIAVDEAATYPPESPRRKTLDADVAKRKKELAEIQKDLESKKIKLDEIDTEYRNKVRNWLEPQEKAVASAEDGEKKVTGLFDRYAKLATQKNWNLGDTFRALPILDAFESPTKIKQIWLPDLTIDYSFKDVPRYDRCTNCHLGIDRGAFDKTSLAKLSDAEENQRLSGKLIKAQEMLEKRAASGENLGFDPTDLPGEQSGHLGWITLIMILSSIVAAGSLGILERSASLGLWVLLGCLVITGATSVSLAAFGPHTPAVRTVKLHEGQVTQYAAHPRLDLFVDSNSPHSMEKFGCTICHAGQGSSTSFTLASHTPNDAEQEKKWKDRHDWESIHHWDFPMLSKHFVESSCVRCRHQMTDLIRQGAKEEAPKLLRGYNLVKENGCFGCHEISGMKAGRPIGPDLRLEPTPALDYLSAADQERAGSDPANPPGTMRKVGPSLRRLAEKTNEEWVRKWVSSPRNFRPDTKMPHFYGLSTNDVKVLEATAPDQASFPTTEIHGIAHYLMVESKANLEGKDFYRHALLAGKENLTALQDALAKTGLSDKDAKELFDVSKRFSDVALLSAPRNVKAIQAHTHRQRQLQERIIELQKRIADLKAKGTGAADLKPTQAEIAATMKELQDVTAALIKSGQPEPIAAKILDENGDEAKLPAKEGDAANGRRLFTEKGCMACHAHEGTTKAAAGAPAVVGQANFGPELSRVEAKINPDLGKDGARRWLVQWLLNPNIYHPRTRMPITHLKVSDANDVAAWLLSHKVGDWKETDPANPDTKSLKALARVYLGKAPGVTITDLNNFLPADGDAMPGIPTERLADLPRDAEERRLEAGTVTPEALLWYIGKKAIGKQACYACHDVPGFETAKPIGTGLNDWGKKDPERLAFEDAETFARTHFNIVPSRTTRQEVEDRITALEAKGDKITPKETKELTKLKERLDVQDKIHELEKKAEKGELSSAGQRELEHLQHDKLFERHEDKEPIEEIFFKALEHPHQSREGFLHQKLLDPRSYDFNRDRLWDERLRMPQFKFARSRKKDGETDEQYQARQDKDEAEAREAVMTFILGLVAEPVPLQYMSQPKNERKAEVLGRQVLDKYNCAGCHQIRPGVFEFKGSDESTLKLIAQAYEITAGENDEKFISDHVFPNHNAWRGAPQTSDRMVAYGYLDKVETEKGDIPGAAVIRLTDALHFTGADKLARDLPAASNLLLPLGKFQETQPYGGTFTDLLVPYLVKKGKPDTAKARAVLPPPLVREGERVQPDWLYKFLLNPGPVRPEAAMVLRMPKFNMSPEEARALVNYFAAVSRTTNPGAGVTYPYVTIDQRDEEYWKRMTAEYNSRLTKEALAARPKPMKPVWEAAAKKELATLEASLPNLKKAEAEAKPEELADRKLAIKTTEERIAGLKEDVKKGTFPELEKRWKSSEIYGRDAYKLLNLCLQCHNLGSIPSAGAQGPNLVLAAERLRPEWTEQWIAHPNRMFTYPPVMPQNFPNVAKTVKYTLYQDSFVGSPQQQTRAVRDILMDSPRLSELLGTPPPPLTPPGGEKK